MSITRPIPTGLARNESPVKDWIRAWLRNDVLPNWWRVGHDPQSVSFFEALDFNGHPRMTIKRRGRVTPRQLYAFGVAKRFGFFDPIDFDTVMASGCAFLLDSRDRNKGRFAGLYAPDGHTVLTNANLYDLSFIALAGSELSRSNVSGASELSEAAFSAINDRFKDDEYGGYFASDNAPQKLANPHMHLLEAGICAFDASRGASGSDFLLRLIDIFERHFFDPARHIVHEKRRRDFGQTEDSWIEPGHGLEWAYLYHEACQRLGRSSSELPQNLLEAAERTAVTIKGHSLIPDRIDAQSPGLTARLWPQLEHLRAVYTLDPGRDLTPLLRTIKALYLSKGPKSGWVDMVDAEGHGCAPHIPASMIYHLMTAFAPILRERSESQEARPDS